MPIDEADYEACGTGNEQNRQNNLDAQTLQEKHDVLVNKKNL